MDKTITGLLGAAAVLTTMAGAQAATTQPTEAPPAASYRDLLDPVPNAVPLLKADNARLAEPKTELAQISIGIGHHHHHHVRVTLGRRHHHHHHHHHHYRHYD